MKAHPDSDSHPDPAPHTPTAPASLRWAIYLLSTVLLFLWVWLLGFVLEDIGDWEGPDYEAIEARHVDAALAESAETLEEDIRGLEVQIRRQQQIQTDLGKSMDNARTTMEQMLDLHRLSLERGVNPSEPQQEALASSQKRFIGAQDRFEQANTEIEDSNRRKFELGQELEAVNRRLDEARRPAREEYQSLREKHKFKVASVKLAFIVPVFLVAAGVYFKRRASLFRPIFLSFLLAAFWKVGVVMFEHFPREFFKYIAIAAAILIVLSFLVAVLRRVARPGAGLLLKRYREAYQRHRCPVCDFPIMRGPLRHAVWTRRKPRLHPGSGAAAAPAGGAAAEEPYACPACGTRLYEACASCGQQRHALLPYCEHCGQGEPT